MRQVGQGAPGSRLVCLEWPHFYLPSCPALHCPALALPCRWLPLGGAAGQCREEHCTGGRAMMGSAGQYSVLAAGTSFDRWKL